jgi:hypothetical protein
MNCHDTANLAGNFHLNIGGTLKRPCGSPAFLAGIESLL